jgi:1-acyl-sn-glycerol-3-phosphate acyltransferase
MIGAILARIFFRVHIVGFKEAPPGPYLLACNHISHFDPPFLAAAMPRRIDFMSMVELFKYRWFAPWLAAIRAFPVNRFAPDPRAVRMTLRRLKLGRIIGIFPEKGIVTGRESIIAGTPLARGVATLAHLSGTPVRTCLVIGSDQLFDWRCWLRRPHVYIILGPEFRCDLSLPKKAARQKLTQEIESALRALYLKLESTGQITPDLIPCTAQERWARR